MGRMNCCHVSVAFVLKLLNFLQAFVGVSIIVYSLWMFDQWSHHFPPSPPPPPPPPPFPASSPSPSPSPSPSSAFSSALLNYHFNSFTLPAPWFIYSFMGVGIILCCISLIGCIAAESIHGCCLCFYTILKTVLILLEVALVAFIAIDHHWEEDLPFDPTGDLESVRSFIEKNVDICKWVGITIITIQALSLLLAIVLRGMISTRRTDFEDEDDFENVRAEMEPLLYQAAQTSASGAHSDIWSSRMREKYGLSGSGKSS